MKIIITIEVDGENINVSTETKESEKEVIEMDDKIKNKEFSDYARFFNDVSPAWTKDAKYNLMYLKEQQSYCNELLRVKGHLFLNDVYEMLGIPKTKTGQIVGWVYDENDPNLDNYVDFGLHDERNYDFINGYTNIVLLDFNVDGNILDRI